MIVARFRKVETLFFRNFSHAKHATLYKDMAFAKTAQKFATKVTTFNILVTTTVSATVEQEVCVLRVNACRLHLFNKKEIIIDVI